MKPTQFRAYAAETASSRRTLSGKKLNVEHDVHNPVVEGAVKDSSVSFTAKQDIVYVAFYSGKGDEEVCVGRIDGPFKAGKISIDVADIPRDEPVDLGNGEFEDGGNVYRPAE